MRKPHVKTICPHPLDPKPNMLELHNESKIRSLCSFSIKSRGQDSAFKLSPHSLTLCFALLLSSLNLTLLLLFLAWRLQLTSLTDSWFTRLPCVRKVPRRTPTSKSKSNSVPIVPQSEPTPAIPGPSSHRAVSETAQHKRKRSREPNAKHPPKKHKSC
uniref:Uncharacterized protein n=1 Tax=Knipowitschia caucasica TaxID=637954 RepID=A0AAV2L2S8_KNICA